MKGKLIVIEGTENSGKETQANLLVERLNAAGIKSCKMRFPMYDTPTGDIIHDHVLNKNDEPYFEDIENPKAVSLYYAADRCNNISKITDLLDEGVNVILDRYVESNIAYQASRFDNISDKINMLLWIEQLEFNLLELPRPDKVIFMYLPYQYRFLIGDNTNSERYKNIEEVYHLMAERYGFEIINLVKNEQLKSIEEINEEILDSVMKFIN